MTIPILSRNELIELIKANGWNIVSTEYWDRYNRLVFGKDGKIITFQFVERYFYPSVVKACEIFGFKAPDEFMHAYYLHLKWCDKPCYCVIGQETGKLFRECHGKSSCLG
jgi:hypothetical protein